METRDMTEFQAEGGGGSSLITIVSALRQKNVF